MARFALLLHHAPDRYTTLSEDDAMTIFKDYMQWMEEHARKGICIDGYKLDASGGRTLSSAGARLDVHETPLAELPEILGGVMLIEAADFEAAVTIARTHPHLVHNRTLEIRKLEDG